MMVLLPWTLWPWPSHTGSSSRGNLTPLPSVSPAARHRTPLSGGRHNGTSPRGTGAMVAAPSGALPRLGHIKTQEKHLTVIGALKPCVCVRESLRKLIMLPHFHPAAERCCPQSVTVRWFTTQQTFWESQKVSRSHIYIFRVFNIPRCSLQFKHCCHDGLSLMPKAGVTH